MHWGVPFSRGNRFIKPDPAPLGAYPGNAPSFSCCAGIKGRRQTKQQNRCAEQIGMRVHLGR